MEEYAREPCPWRIIDDCGGAFSMLDQIDSAIQKGLKVLLDIYTGSSGVIKKVDGSIGVYSLFHAKCEGINVQ